MSQWLLQTLLPLLHSQVHGHRQDLARGVVLIPGFQLGELSNFHFLLQVISIHLHTQMDLEANPGRLQAEQGLHEHRGPSTTPATEPDTAWAQHEVKPQNQL